MGGRVLEEGGADVCGKFDTAGFVESLCVHGEAGMVWGRRGQEQREEE